MKTHAILATLLSGVILYACNPPEQTSLVSIDPDRAITINDSNHDNLLTINRITLLEETPESYIKILGKILQYGEFFLVSDINTKLLIHDNSGKLIKIINRVGRGPQEYISLIDFDINTRNNHLWILGVGEALEFADMGGSFIKKIKLPQGVTRFKIIDDHLVCALEYQGKILVVSEDGKLVDEFSDYQIGVQPNHFPFIQIGKSYYFLGKGANFTLTYDFDKHQFLASQWFDHALSITETDILNLQKKNKAIFLTEEYKNYFVGDCMRVSSEKIVSLYSKNRTQYINMYNPKTKTYTDYKIDKLHNNTHCYKSLILNHLFRMSWCKSTTDNSLLSYIARYDNLPDQLHQELTENTKFKDWGFAIISFDFR